MTKFIDVEKLAEKTLELSGAPRLDNGIAIDVMAILQGYRGLDVAAIEGLRIKGQALLGAFIPAYNLVMFEVNCLETRQRYTLAHELGHAEIEFGLAGQPSLDTLGSDADRMFFRCDSAKISEAGKIPQSKAALAETLANKFAAAILMPRDLVLTVWNKHRDLETCANLLTVSRAAFSIRLETLLPTNIEAKPIPRLI
jgi:predicted transcriptional regulator